MGKRYEVILLDLDGTLTESAEGIARSVQYALAFFGIEVEDWQQLKHFVGPPLLEAFMEHYGFSREQAGAAVEKYRERFAQKGIFENKPYQGVEEALAALKQRGKILALATSKPEVFAKKIVEHFGLVPYLDLVAGSQLDGTRSKKDEVIAYVLEQLHIQDRSKAVMVGDRIHDMAGAAANGIDAIGVLYGYGSMGEFSNAVFVAKTPKELEEFLQ